MNWSAPVTTLDPHWAHELVPFWAWVVAFCEPFRGDAIAGREYTAARDLLDSLRNPDQVDVVNARWREFIVAIWKISEAWQARMSRRPVRR